MGNARTGRTDGTGIGGTAGRRAPALLLPILALLTLGAGGPLAAEPVRIVGTDEPGEPLLVTGTVYGPDGSIPQAGVVIQFHNTNVRGVYSRDGSGDGRIEGEVITDATGAYALRTIKPGSYPGGGVPAHIHFTISTTDGRRQTGEIRFQDDPQIAAEAKARALQSGTFAAIQPLTRGEDGVLRCVFDIRLRR
jgi:protocatechuate 3,4-dioxygenase beta subunit